MDEDLLSALHNLPGCPRQALQACSAGVDPASLSRIWLPHPLLLPHTPHLSLTGLGSRHHVPPLRIQVTASTHPTWVGPGSLDCPSVSMEGGATWWNRSRAPDSGSGFESWPSLPAAQVPVCKLTSLHLPSLSHL